MNNYYRTQDIGGWNPCIYGNTEFIPLDWNRNVLPNCVGYAVGRFNEMANTGDCRYLGNSNANWFLNWAYAQGLEVGNDPRKGACMVWDYGEYGHVAIVEEVYNNDDVLVSESGWSAHCYTWNARHYRNSDGNWTAGDDCGWMQGYRFLGFIYNPAFPPVDKNLPNPVEENKEVDQFKVNCNDTMFVRLDHKTSGESIGLAREGFYNILNRCDDDGYTWFEVEENKWIALLPPYSDYIPKEEKPEPTSEPEPEPQPEPTPTPEPEPTPEPTPDENIFVKIVKFIIDLLKKIFMKGE